MTAFIQKHYKVTQSQYQFVRTITYGCNEATYKLFCHILVCDASNITARADTLFIPISSNLIDRELKQADWQELQRRQLIEIKPHNRALRKSREYKVADSILFEFLRIGDIPAAEYLQDLVNIFTGRSSKRVDKSEINDANGHPQPKLVRQAMKVFKDNPCPFDLPAIEQYLIASKAAICQFQQGSKDYIQAEARYRANLSCRNAALMRKLEYDTEGISFYTSAYNISKSGRIHQVGGALQSCSRQMKHEAFSGISNLYNYDLEASQINVLIQFFQDAGIDSGWLEKYKDTENNKSVYAEQAGLPKDTWKTCLLALVMGAHLPSTTKNYKDRDNTILKELAKIAGEDEDKLKELLAGFTEVVMPLVERLRQWHEWLLSVYIPREKQHSRAGSFIKNSVGMRMYLSDLFKAKLRWLAKAKLAAFLLQGVEACTIHHLTLLGDKYGYTPVSNEHDGLITIATIPVEAVNEASSLSGFRNAKLSVKEFV